MASSNKRRTRRRTNTSTSVNSNRAGTASSRIDALPEHADELLETEKNEVKAFPKYRRFVAEIMRWLKQYYPDDYPKLVFEISDEEKTNPRRHYHNATHDFRYDLLHPDWIKLFISNAKKWKDKENGIQYGFDHPRMYHDAVLKCSGKSNFSLHEDYRSHMKVYLDNLKKEKAKAKTDQQLDENGADPIGFQLYYQLCTGYQGSQIRDYGWNIPLGIHGNSVE